MTKIIICILLSVFAVSCLNRKTNEKQRTPQRYYYKHISKDRDEPQEERIVSYSIQDVSWIDDSMFVKTTHYTTSFKIRKVENKTFTNEVFIIKNGEVYSVKKNGTRLYLSTTTSECVEYLSHPNSYMANAAHGKRHCFVGKDTTKANDILYKFRVDFGIVKGADVDENLLISFKGENESLYLFCYDEDFVLYSAEYIGSLNMYFGTERIEPSSVSTVPLWVLLDGRLEIKTIQNNKTKEVKQT